MDSEYILGSDGEIYHHGIKGMRWGHRRYQTKDGSLTPAGRKRYDKDMAKVKAATKKLKAQERTDKKIGKLEEAKKNLAALKSKKKGKGSEEDADNKKKSAETDEQTRDRILKSPNAKDVIENRHLFNDREIQSLRIRLQEEQTIKNMVPAEVDKGKEFVGKTVDKFNQISTLVDNGSKAWNSVAKIYNSFWGDKNGVTLPTISDKVTSKLDKFKEETDWIKAKNERAKAEKEAKGEKSELERAKEAAEMTKAINEQDKAAKEYADRHSEVARKKEETAAIDADNKNREAKRASRAHDKSDAKEAAEKAKSEAEAKAKAAKDTQELIDKYRDSWPSESDSKTKSGKQYVDWRTKNWEREEGSYYDWRNEDWDDD